jgi:hypothetical protein
MRTDGPPRGPIDDANGPHTGSRSTALGVDTDAAPDADATPDATPDAATVDGDRP